MIENATQHKRQHSHMELMSPSEPFQRTVAQFWDLIVYLVTLTKQVREGRHGRNGFSFMRFSRHTPKDVLFNPVDEIL
jgi:hypothetical protein